MVWKIFHKMEGKTSFNFQYPIEINNTLLTDVKKIAASFALYYKDMFKQKSLSKNSVLSTSIGLHLNLNFNSDYNSKFSISELKNAISSLNTSGAMA